MSQKYALHLLPSPDKGLKTMLGYEYIAAPYKPVPYNTPDELRKIVKDHETSCKGSVTVTGTPDELRAMGIEALTDEDFYIPSKGEQLLFDDSGDTLEIITENL
jgi:hypothetical protein